jgi:hypothetical protein
MVMVSSVIAVTRRVSPRESGFLAPLLLRFDSPGSLGLDALRH